MEEKMFIQGQVSLCELITMIAKMKIHEQIRNDIYSLPNRYICITKLSGFIILVY